MALISGLIQHGTGNDFDADSYHKMQAMLREFDAAVEEICEQGKIRRATVRSRLDCQVFIILDPSTLWVIGEKARGMAHATLFPNSDDELSIDEVVDAATNDLGLDTPFVISFPRRLLDQWKADRAGAIHQIAASWVDSEVARGVRISEIVQVKPIFGPADFVRDPQLCFVLMPFEEQLDEIYRTAIKPAVEAKGLVCRRADEIRSNHAIMQDIWRSLCEARLVVADLTRRNPNVAYELGIAHTLGRDTILLTQPDERNFPFDFAHIRRINYEDSIPGGAKLRIDLEETIEEILKPVVLSAL